MNASALAADLDRALNTDNVVPLKQLTHEERLERLAGVHRDKEHSSRMFAADIRKQMKAEQTEFKADEKAEIARHLEAMALIAEQAAASKERSEALIAGSKKMEAYNRGASEAALAALGG